MKRATVFLVALFVLVSLAPAQENPADASLVARWMMRNTGGSLLEDLTNRHHGWLHGNVTFTTDVVMPHSVALRDGSGALVVPHSEELEPARGTVTMWIKVEKLHRGDIFYKGTPKTLRTSRRNGVGGAVYGARLLADGSIQAYILNDDPHKSEWTFLESPRPVIHAQAWHHIALQWDGKFFRLYVDGGVVAKKHYKEIPGVGLSYYGDIPLYFGAGDDFIGQFGEVRIYNDSVSEEVVQRVAQLPGPR